MSDIMAFVVIFAAVVFTAIVLGGRRPEPATIARPCVERGRVQQIVWSALDPSEATVICRDGTVHKVSRP